MNFAARAQETLLRIKADFSLLLVAYPPVPGPDDIEIIERSLARIKEHFTRRFPVTRQTSWERILKVTCVYVDPNAALALMLKKRADYGIQNILVFGELGVLVRSWDKLSRLKNLMGRQGQVPDESIQDTWVDLFNYALIAIMLIEGTYEAE